MYYLPLVYINVRNGHVGKPDAAPEPGHVEWLLGFFLAPAYVQRLRFLT